LSEMRNFQRAPWFVFRGCMICNRCGCALVLYCYWGWRVCGWFCKSSYCASVVSKLCANSGLFMPCIFTRRDRKTSINLNCWELVDPLMHTILFTVEESLGINCFLVHRCMLVLFYLIWFWCTYAAGVQRKLELDHQVNIKSLTCSYSWLFYMSATQYCCYLLQLPETNHKVTKAPRSNSWE
jgi:hypothetical protein